MNRKPELRLTEGSEYKILSIGARDTVLETEGIFKGFASLGVDEMGLLMELSKQHGNMAGKLRIVPLHAVLAIDILTAQPDQKEDDEGVASHYVV